MPDLGVRLQLMIGPTVPMPAPYHVVDALLSLEVTNSDSERDGFQMTFSVGKEPLLDYGLLRDGLLDPPNRVMIIVIIGTLPQMLIDGMITRHELAPSRDPGQSQLTVTGEDIGLQLEFEDKSATYRNLSDSVIVTQIVSSYGLTPDVTSTEEVPPEVERITTQQCTDLEFIKKLARRNGFVFYVEPGDVPGLNRAYWGPEERSGTPQPPLKHDMGADTNVDYIQPGFSALDAVTPRVTITEPITRQSIPIPLPSGFLPSLASRPATPLRTTVPRDTANLNLIQGMLRALTEARGAGDAVTAYGELDAARYGHALRARRLVKVHGVGNSYDGTYYVQEVKHRIRRGEYKQSFRLKREGLGAA
jgi:hypothetical protein